jgi:GT2 family glycosyltransferase
MPNKKVAVVILNFNGKHHLQKFLPSVIEHSDAFRIVLADNASTDGSVEFIKSTFPRVTIIQHSTNLGYAGGYNKALEQIGSEYYLLLNSDVEVTENWLKPLVELMDSDPEIASCQPKLLDFTYRETFEYAGASGGYMDYLGYPFCRGRIFNSLEKDEHQYDSKQEVFWASGASMMLRADHFWKAGGFDEDYFAHMEEIDLCWRLKNLGYKIYVEPKSVVYHLGAGTLKKTSARKTYLNFRNNISTLVKNEKSSRLLLKLPARLILDGVAAIKFLVEGHPAHLFAVIRAHFSFYFRFPSLLIKKGSMKVKPGFRYNRSQTYKGTLVFDYFIRRKKKFSDLYLDFFS